MAFRQRVRRATAKKLAIVVAVAAVATALVTALPRGAQSLAVFSLSFDPDGRFLAVVIGTTGSERASRWVCVFEEDSERPLFAAPCATRSSQWLAGPSRLAYGVKEGRETFLVVRAPSTGPSEVRSPGLDVADIGPLGARDDSIAFLARRRDGGSDLCLWRVEESQLSRWPVPSQFLPSLAVPPAISEREELIALVHKTDKYFVAFNTVSDSWVEPVCEAAMWGGWRHDWKWTPVGAEPVNTTLWRTAFITVEKPLGPDRFFVDEKSLSLWVAIRGRSHATPTPQGLKLWFFPDRLYPLDLDGAKASAPYSAEQRNVLPPIIWAEEAGAMSSSSARDRIAVIYPTKAGHECRLAWGREPGETRAESTLISDASVLPSAVAMSGDGTRVAIARGTGADGPPRIEILDTATGEALAAWDLSVPNAYR